MMKIAVLIPVYNAERYLSECLRSVFVAEPDYVLCGLDGSTDGSEAIVDEFAALHSNLIKVKHPNIGVSATRNDLLDRLPSDADLIAFCDSDDWVDKEIYSRLRSALIAEAADVAECGIWHGDDWNAPNWINIVNKLYRREAIGNVRFRPSLAFEEDNFFNREVNRHVQKRALVNIPLYHYRENPLSVTSALDLQKYFDSAAERVRLTKTIFGLDKELAKDAYRMLIRKNLKKNRDAMLKRQLFQSAGDFFRSLGDDLHDWSRPLNPIQSLIFNACVNDRYLLARALICLT